MDNSSKDIGRLSHLAKLEAENKHLRAALAAAGVHVDDARLATTAAHGVTRLAQSNAPICQAAGQARDLADGRTELADSNASNARLLDLNHELRASEERISAVVESATGHAVIEMDFDGRITGWSSGAERLLGWTAAEAVGQAGALIWTPEDRAAGLPEREIRIATDAGSAAGDRWYLRRDGTRFWGSGHLTPLRNGRPRGYLKVLRDRTAERNAEEMLRANEAKYRALFDSMDEGFCIIEMLFDAAGSPDDYLFLEVNVAFERQSGMHGSVGRRMREIAPAHEAHWFETYGRVARTGQPEHFVNCAEALSRWFDVYAFRIGGASENRVAILFNDITASKHSDVRLRESEARFRALATAGTYMIYRMSPDWRRMYQLDGRDFLADTPEPVEDWADLYIPAEDQVTVFAAIDDAIRSRSMFSLEHRVRNAEGGIGWMLSRAVPVLGPDGEVAEWFGAATDVTARRVAEDRQTFLLKLSDALRPLTDPTAVQGEAVRVLGEHLQAGRAYYVEADEEAGDYVVAQDWHLPGETSHAGRFPMVAWPMPWLANGQTWVVRDTATDAVLPDGQRDTYRGQGVGALIVVPLVKQGRLVANCVVDQRAPRDWTSGEIRLVEETAERTWAAVEHVRAEAALRRSEAKYRMIFETIDQAFWMIEVIQDASGKVTDYRFLEANPNIERVTGLANVVGRLVSDVVPNLESYWIEPLTRVILTGEANRIEAYNENTRRWYRSVNSRIGGDGSRLIGVFFDDITERKEHEQRQAFLLRLSDALRAEPSGEAMTERALRMLFEQMRLDRCYVGIYQLAEDRADFPNQVHDDRLPPLPTHVRLSDFPEALQVTFDRTLVADNVATMEGLSDSERASFAGLGMGALISATLRKGPNIPLWAICAVSTRPRAWTQGEVALVEETAERTWSAVERDRAEAALREATAQHTEKLEDRVRERTAELMVAEASLRQAQKMEAIGQLTGGIAHDFNNMLQGVVGGLEIARRRIDDGRREDAMLFMEAAEDAAGRAAALTRRLLAFARPQQLDPHPVEADALLTSMIDLIKRSIGPQISLDLVLCDGSWPVLCDPSELEGAILNLCINARDAMPEGGRLTIMTEDLHIVADNLRRADEAALGDFVAIRVVDTGIGMPLDVQERATEPFFTTKPQGEGTGLGLSQVWGFVRQSGGQLRIESTPGRGTAVHILLPRARPEAWVSPGSEDVALHDAAPVASATVLLVDDEVAVRAPVAERLRDFGFRVIEAPDGPTALSLLDDGLRPDLLITDIGLPNGMNGRQVIEAVCERMPGLPVLIVTGYAATALPAGIEVIGKPFDLNVLARRVCALLTPEQQGAVQEAPHV